MKKLMLIASCAVLILAAGCNDKNKPQEPNDAPLAGTVENPAWQSPKQYDMTASMTAVVKIDFAKSFTDGQLDAVKDKMTDGQIAHEGDLLAAFSGENCLGVDTLRADTMKLFYLFVTATADNADDIQLRYYSSQLKNIFVARQAFTFSNDQQLGSVAEPYTPTWEVAE